MRLGKQARLHSGANYDEVHMLFVVIKRGDRKFFNRQEDYGNHTAFDVSGKTVCGTGVTHIAPGVMWPLTQSS